MQKNVLIIGASGLIGSELVQLLLRDDKIKTVKVFVRKSLAITDQKIREILVDFEHLEDFKHEFQGDALFCCIGTTRKKTPDLAAYKAVDYGIVLTAANLARSNHVPQVHLVSAIGAAVSSKIFYNRLKGEIEKDVLKLDFPTTLIYQPAMLIGKRSESRPAEFIAQKLMPFFDVFLLGKTRKYHSIEAKKVAESMLDNLHKPKEGATVLSYSEMISAT
ncbi:MAG: NAD-dependent epimerase/dehydratase family protein [Crocinitomicaceae bacterium]|nr:NAD-dependent epimerase/dehydratase family protein [Crocinitomicaceae bacterium]